MPQIDYAALAKQFGGTTVPASTSAPFGGGVDYNAIAARFGGTTVPAASPVSKPLVGVSAENKPRMVSNSEIMTPKQGTLANLPGAVADIFTHSSQGFGKTLGATAAVGLGTNKKIDAASMAESESRRKLAKLLNDPNTSPIVKDHIRSQLAQGTDVAVATTQLPDLNKTNEQVFGEGLGTALEVLQGGALSRARTTVAETVGKAALKGAATGAAYGGLGAASEAMQQNKPIDDVAKSTAVGAVIGGGTGAALGAATHQASAAETQKKISKAIGQIGQSKVGDVETHTKALLSLDPAELKRVKTYSDLNAVIDDNLTALRTAQDAHFATQTDLNALDSFSKTIGQGKAAVTTNPINDAIGHLTEFYRAANEPEALSRMLALKDKAETVGLTAGEVNQIARDYGSDMMRAFNPRTGEALTSVNAQASENTRKAVKAASRSSMPNGGKEAAALDESMSNLLDLKRSTQQIEEKVNALSNKVKERSILERAGRIAGKGVDTLSGGSIKGFFTSFLPSNVGEKTMNFLDIQRALPKNLALLNKLEGMSDGELTSWFAKILSAGRKGLGTATPAITRKAGEIVAE